MRVLLVSQEMPPETNWGGIGTYVDVLSEALATKGHEVHVLSVVDEQPASRTKRGHVTVHRFAVPRARDPSRRFPESWRRVLLGASVARLVPQLGVVPDVIECPEWMAEGLGLGLGRGQPLIVRLHSSARQIFPMSGQGHYSRGLDGRLAAWLEEASARRAYAVISTGTNLEDVKGRCRLEESAIHAIPYPVRMPPFAPIDDLSPPCVTFVGRLETRKAPEVVLRAAPKVLSEVPEARFVFVGRDVMPGAVGSADWLRAEAARLGIAHAVEVTGQLDRSGLTAQLSRATVCAFPSRWESFGNVVVEASAVGRPVVVTPIPPFRELVKDGVTGRLVNPEDTHGWARALSGFLRDRPLAKRFGEAGAAHVAGISHPARVADLTLAAYEQGRQRWRQGLRAGRRPVPRPSRRR
jgi:glycosyltransferase involved in cell wall biosynthesis